MKHAMLATWAMSYEGVKKGFHTLLQTENLEQAIADAITLVEDEPSFTSVGYGGLPNRNGTVELDAAYMNGDTLGFGAVMGVENVKNPILVAQSLSHYRRSNVLCGHGAELYAQKFGFQFANMLTPESQKAWEEKCKKEFNPDHISSYDEGHDTVCVIGKYDTHMEAGVSTSGLYMKHPGRVGDSPIIGSGLYCDNEAGGAAATGVGEDIMKGCLSYEIVRLLKQGVPVQNACEQAMQEHVLAFQRRGLSYGSMSVLAMDRHGNFGAASTIPFPFVYQCDTCQVTLYTAYPNADGTMRIEKTEK